jgi:S1-C subfamily serine protease
MRRTLALLGLLALFLSPPAATAADPDEVYRRSVGGVVWIENVMANKNATLTGTGFLVDRTRGFVVTNYHVTDGNDRMHVYFPVRSQGKLVTDRSYYQKNRSALYGSSHYYYARVIASDPVKDLAVLYVGRTPESAPVLPIAAAELTPDDQLQLIGNPAGRDLWRSCPATRPRVGRLRHTFADGQAVDFKSIDVYSGSFGGNSGGPLLNEDGEVAGVWQSGGGNGGQNGTAIHFSELRDVIGSCKKYRMFAVENTSGTAIPYQVRWGEGEWKDWSVGTKKWMVHWIPAANTAQPQVRFDSSAASGFQEKVYDVKCYAMHFGRGVTPAQSWAARQYQFKFDGQTVELLGKQ